MTYRYEAYLDEGAARWIRAAQAGEFVEKRVQGGPPSYSTGGWNSGPAFTDWNRTRRAPTPFDLVEAWRQLTFGCSVLNANAVSRQPLRLFVSTSLGQHRPKSYLRGRPLTRAASGYLRSQPEYGQYVKSAEEIDEVTEHPLLTLLGEVNPDWDHIRLIRYTSICLDIIGRAHWLPGDERGQPTRGRLVPPFLWPLLAQYVLPYRDSEGSLVSHYNYFSNEYDPTELINFRGDSLRDPYALGQSPTQAAFAFVGLSDSYTQLMENMMTQSIRPSVIVTNKNANEPFGDAERRRLQREINYQLSAGGAGKAWVVDGSVDIKTLTFPPTSLAENEISETAVKYVSFIFGVPLSFLRNEDSNRAVAEAGHYQHAKLGVEPRCVNIASTLTKWTHAEGRRRGQDWSRLLWAFDNPVKEDEQRETTIFDMRLKNGSTTVNEYRMHLGYNRVPWGDEPWLPSSLVQPSAAKEQSQTSRRPEIGSPDDSLDDQEKQYRRKSESLVARVDDRGAIVPDAVGNTLEHAPDSVYSAFEGPGSADAAISRAFKSDRGRGRQRYRFRGVRVGANQPRLRSASGRPRANGGRKGNPYHDERGRFASGPHSGRQARARRRRRTRTQAFRPLAKPALQSVHYDTSLIPGPNPNKLRQRVVTTPTSGQGGVYLKPQNGKLKIGSTKDFKGRYGKKEPEPIQIEILQTRDRKPRGVNDQEYPWTPRKQRRFDEEYVDRTIHPDARYRAADEKGPVRAEKWKKYRHIFGYGNVPEDFNHKGLRRWTSFFDSY